MANDSKDSSSSPFGMPGAGNLQSVMESMQKAWGFASNPSVAPTIDIDEIDRRLEDLKTVSQWLALNQNMLQSSIQALQVQKATLTAIKSFGVMPGSSGSDEPGISAMDMMQAFSKAFTSPPAEAPHTEPPEPSPTAESAAAEPESTPAEPVAGMGGLDPQQWWNMLQNQFAQVAALALEQNNNEPAPAEKASPRPERKSSGGAKATKKRPATRKPDKSAE